jgi:hypothetical protein
MTDDADFSRPIAAAMALGDHAEGRYDFFKKKVLLTGETGTLASDNGAEIARDTLMLLIRMWPNVVVSLPQECEDLESELKELAKDLDPVVPVSFQRHFDAYEQFDAILSIGTLARTDLPWTVINSHGWLARISSGSSNLPPQCDQANPVGALAAACLGVDDVFKRLVKLHPDRGELLDNVSFSLWAYSMIGDPGPELPAEVAADLFMVGAGAIGNGTAHLLSRLPISGRASIIDKQAYRIENWGTCLCLRRSDAGSGSGEGTDKAEVLADLLKSKMDAKPYRIDIAEALSRLGSELPYPKIVLGGLDDIDARHAVQKLWPDVVIDGAIGGDFSCQVSCHPWGEDVACQMCLFRHAQRHERAEAAQSRITGLSEDVCLNAEAVVTNDDVRNAPVEKQEWLSKQVGKKVCSVIAEAFAQQISIEALPKGFAPSVAFVACFSSCMIVTELLRYLMTGKSAVQPRWQFNLLWGPGRGEDYPQRRRPDCFCVEYAGKINTVRSVRF